jgi:hypothetical protein
LIVPPKEPKQDFNSHIKEPSRIWKGEQDKLNIEECSISLQCERKKKVFGTLKVVVQSTQ